MESPIVLHREVEYDSLCPEYVIDKFLEFTRNVQSLTYQLDAQIEEYRNQEQDFDHYIELSDDLSEDEAYKVYCRIKDMRRERRKCKNEKELLEPVLDWITNAESSLKSLQNVLGKIRKNKVTIDNRAYVVRTHVFEEDSPEDV